MLFNIFYFIVVIGFISIVFVSLFYEGKAAISPTPVLPWVRRKALSLLSKCDQPTSILKIADLGCGWGGMIGQLQKKYPTAKITGYEISPCPYYFSKFRFGLSGDQIAIKRNDFFKEGLSDYDVVFCYLSPSHMEKLKPILLKLKKGSLVVSCSFPIQGWEPIAATTVWSLVKVPVCVYRI